ncbi:MAG: 30S ribosomal protein S8 [Candidatus Liptonbacteria bacterium]|nr:30S ribosomal protein S8 [Candidatus Liptonbacteria bacterium]
MYYDLLPKLKNAEAAGKETVLAPFSKMDLSVCKILADAGYIKDAKEKTLGRKRFIEIRMFGRRKRLINGVKIMSKPSRHLYFSYTDLRPVKSGHGIGVISTSKGMMTQKEARKKKVGGEYLFQIW